MKTLLLTLSFIALFAAPAANAGSLGFEGNFFNSAHTLSSEKNTSFLYGDAYLTLPLYEKATLHFVFNYTFMQETYKPTASTAVSILHMGPMVGARKRFCEVCYITVMGTPYIQADYKVTGASKEQWIGWAYQARLSLEGEMSRNVGLIVSINYFSSTYTQKPDGATSTQDSFTRAAIIPAAGFVFRF